LANKTKPDLKAYHPIKQASKPNSLMG